MKNVLMLVAALLLSVTISAQNMGGQGGPGGPGGGMPPGGQKPMGPPPGGKKGKAPKKEKHKKKDNTIITVDELYAYGVGVKDGDSTVYMTDLLILKKAKLLKKTKFLINRSDYSAQFKNYLSENLNDKLRTCAIVFNRNLKKLSKDYDKLKTNYAKRHLLVKIVDQTQFRFEVPEE